MNVAGLCWIWLEPKPDRTSRNPGTAGTLLGGEGSDKRSLGLSFPSRIYQVPGSKSKDFKTETAEQ